MRDPWDIMEEHERLAAEEDARRRNRRDDWIRRAKSAGQWGEVEQLRDLVRRLTDAYAQEYGSGSCNHALLREALAAVEAMPPPPWDGPP